ncbi:replication protein A 70 kDa DNA-binding subunit B-like [Coffea arabica]|uniref:Replication protein A 70 kDa DNA-binding subunit B-like n=1 Tax=Coffea arabica TaxID=13443 RepID=A0ABM4WZJ6_COFAR
MPRHISSVLNIQKGAEKWTVLAQVVHKGHSQLTREVPPRRIMRFLLTDAEGTKVSVVTYEQHIKTFSKFLQPYQRYYVSNAIVVPADPTYRVGTYECSWILNYKTLIENYAEPVPPMLPCIFELTNFSDLHKYADSDNLCNIRGFVIHAFPIKQPDPASISRDIIIVNEEKKLMLMTLWNEFEHDEGSKIADMISTAPLIIALRVKVTTFNTLSFTTRYSSGILISPPLPDDLSLRQWFSLNKEEIRNLLDAKTYNDANCLLPPPNEEDIKAISNFQASFPVQKAAWVQGTVKLAYGFSKYWTTACANCHKIVNADIDWIIHCPSCKQQSEVELRARIPIIITDASSSIHCIISGEDAEKLIEFTPLQLKQAQEDGFQIDTELNDALKKYTVVCFLKSYETPFQGQLQKKNTVIKAYTAAELSDRPIPLELPENTQVSSALGSSSARHAETSSKDQLFTPSTKLLLEEIAGASSYKDSQTSATSGAKRSLEFPEDLPADTDPKQPTKAPEEFAKEPAKPYGPPANIKDSPAKKPKAKED